MKSETALVRTLRLIRILHARRASGATVRELASELEVNEKTIRRDLIVLKRVGFPIDEAVGPHGRKSWSIASVNGQATLTFNLDEALALYLGRRLLAPLAGTVVGDAAHRAFAKVRDFLGTAARRYVDRLADNLHLTVDGSSSYSQKRDQLDELLRAIAENRQTIITYQSAKATEPVEHAIDPLALAQHRGKLYLIAWSHDHGEVRTFKIDRIAEVEVSGLPFQRPDGFDVRSYLSGSFGIYHTTGDVTVRVRFLPPAARYVLEGHWHASQRLEKQKDGSVIAQFRLSGTEEIKRWILSFGRHAEALAPEGLRGEIRDERAAMARQYADR